MEPDTPGRDEPVTSVAKMKTSVPKAAGKSKKRGKSRRRKSAGRVGRSKPRYSHASVQATVLSFDDTVQIKERFNYNTQLPVGLNFFWHSDRYRCWRHQDTHD